MSYLDFDIVRSAETEKILPLIQGKGQRSLLLVLDADLDMEVEEVDYLQKICIAAKLSPLEEQLFQLMLPAGMTCSLSQINREMDVKKVIIFGVLPTRLGVKAILPTYEWQQIGNLRLLLVDSVRTIREARAAGKKEQAQALWSALQEMEG